MTTATAAGEGGVRRIAELEAVARQLEPGPEGRELLRGPVVAHSESFYEGLDDALAYRVTEDKGSGLLDVPITEEGIGIDETLRIVREHVDRPGLNPASGGHMAYIPGGGVFTSSLGDYLADVGNHYSGVFFATPGAARLEGLLVRWMSDLVGYPETALGTLTSGGSIANLTGIVTARDAMGIHSRDVERSTIYLSGQVHHCVTKSLRLAGLGDAPVRYVPLDERYRMRADELARLVEEDRRAGLKPWLVVASSGTTDTGAVDPVDEIADVTESNGVWLHVDAAYGGFFLLSETGRALIQGLERSDSVVLDPHKGLFLPYGTGALLVREGELLARSQHYEAAYLQDALSSTEELSPADLSPELTRHFRGLRMWMPLVLHGLKPFRAALEEKIQLCRYFYEELERIPGMKRGPYPELSVALYRYVPRQGDPNEFNARLIREVREDGRVFLSSTRIDGVFYLRLAVLCFRTHRKHVDLALDVLREKIAKLEG
ncbi:MAG: aminotransferase class I/II-fold pyridoxal phosphate-dependent enzyme [Gemmatimonadota bacterium]|nr:aminotransferase class I/II-fold pyridoxal phosphate-dependent enzyme [Gemmatimonadota bacterium]